MNRIANIAPEKRQRGRPLGSRNKIPALLKDAILMAAEDADEEGLVGFLKKQALTNPVAFMSLLGKVLPLQTTGEGGGPLEIRWLPPQECPPELAIGLGDPLPPGPQTGLHGSRGATSAPEPARRS